MPNLGFVGGQQYDIVGSGSNLLCLPDAPFWANRTEKLEDVATISGSEFQFEATTADTIFSFENAEELHNYIAPCTVCLRRKPAVVLMLPARTECYSGWITEYYGYLMSEYDNSKGRHDYVCIDHAPEIYPDVNVHENGNLLTRSGYMLYNAMSKQE